MYNHRSGITFLQRANFIRSTSGQLPAIEPRELTVHQTELSDPYPQPEVNEWLDSDESEPGWPTLEE